MAASMPGDRGIHRPLGSLPPNPPTPEPDLVGATLWYRRLLLFSAMMWALGFVRVLLRDSGVAAHDPGMDLLIGVTLGIALVVVIVGVGIAGVAVASRLDLPRAWAWGGAWVPCVNPFAVMILGIALLSRYSERGWGVSVLFKRRADLQSMAAQGNAPSIHRDSEEPRRG